ncbi:MULTISPECIES: type II toxin-antitoxin system RelB family antitoxin [Pseudomonas]|jgi:hypothetical protein|uniref:type II toxin-antitoxin system RelB family antitoxin n=1 Tax=Pseudomonas TaxID=286 RepID=UPI0022C5CD34|nr:MULTISPECIES: hypothetical protein [Pseudomonas]GLH39177.1 hypothetical protein RS1P1_34620 [Pseudomonas moraviensis]
MQFIQTTTTAIPVSNSLPGIDPGGTIESKIFAVDSGFEIEGQAVGHDRWLRAKVQASRDDPHPSLPHEDVMADMHALIESIRSIEKRQFPESPTIKDSHDSG